MRRFIRRIRQEIGNAYLNMVSPSKARVMIARDVIAHLDAKRFIAEQGSYVTRPDGAFWEQDEFEREVRQASGIPAGGCEVCAVGGLMMARFERADRVSRGELNGEVAWREALGKFFDTKTLVCIEAAFEQDIIIPGSQIIQGYSQETGYDYREIRNLLKPISDWSRLQLSNDTDTRLREIMEILIENNGEFVIP